MTGIIKKIVNKKVGFTLIEIVIAVSMFSVVIVIALDSFIKVIQINRQTVQSQDLQNNIRFLYELMSKEIKMAQKGDGRCNDYFRGHIGDYSFSHASRVYSTVEHNGNSVLFLRNYHNQCVIYYLDKNTNRLKIKRQDLDSKTDIGDVFVLPSEINVTSFSVDVTGDFKPILHTPYSVVLYMDLSNQEWDPAKIGVQTAVTARYIE
ncbi:MAG: prepilin-type N-terminal cleavage/methylation domain-containing protein [bacterium]